MIMWYVLPDLNELNVDAMDVKSYKDYYKYIKDDVNESNDILQNIFGRDIALVILPYVPDYLHLYIEKLESESE